MPSIFNNDEVREFLRANGYIEQYNDGLTAYLRELFSSNLSLPDLLRRYITEYGTSLDLIGDFLVSEEGDFFVTEDGIFFVLDEEVLSGDALLLEGGDRLLLESGDFFLLEA